LRGFSGHWAARTRCFQSCFRLRSFVLVEFRFPSNADAGLEFPLAGILFFGNFRCVIKSFADGETGKVFNLAPSRKLPGEIQTRAKVKLDQLHAASELNHLRVPPSNRLEKLSGNLRDFHSIRINQQWRIIFVWKDNHANQVQIIDYH